MRTGLLGKLLAWLLGLTVLASLWFYFAPAPLGGSTTYVVTHGISMEPRFHSGDLALVRSRSRYRVGEIVAYHSKMLRTIVLHRIIGRDGDRYIFKGDNNNFVDFEHPAASQLIGALWIHVPGLGARLQSIRSPALVGVLIALGLLLFSGVAFTRRRRERHARDGTPAPAASRLPHVSASPVLVVLAAGAFALAPFVLLAVIAFASAGTHVSAYKVRYQQSGALSYSAAATPGPVYENNRAVTGDPLFTHVLDKVALRYAYRFAAPVEHSLKGKASLSATVVSSDGWHTTRSLGAPTYFHGDRAVATGTLDLPSLLGLLKTVERSTEAHGTYTLTISPQVSASGVAAGEPISAVFAPNIQFSLSETEIQPGSSRAGSPAAAATAAEFSSSSAGSATVTRHEPLSISLGLARVSVGTARVLALVMIALIAVVLIAVLAFLQPIVARLTRHRREELAPILARYGRLIVPVEHIPELPGVAVIDVADMDALTRIAEHYDRSILHEKTRRGDAFWVTDESGYFRWILDAPPTPSRPAREADTDEHVLPPRPNGRPACPAAGDWDAERVTAVITAEGESWDGAGEAADTTLYDW